MSHNRRRTIRNLGAATFAALLVPVLHGPAPALAVECYTPRAWQPRLTDAPFDTNGNRIHDALDGMPAGARRDIVLDLNRCAGPADQERFSAYGQVLDIGDTLSYLILGGVAASDLPRLAADEQVAFVDALIDMNLDLDLSRQVVGADQVNNVLGFDGTGVGIAVIDTGVDDHHHATFPANTPVSGIDCTSAPPTCQINVNPDDPASMFHGTAVASIALGRGGGDCPACIGIAPDAKLIDVKVFHPAVPIGQAVLGGMNSVIKQRVPMDIEVVNMSYSNCVASNGQDVFSAMAQRIVQAGMVGVVSMGNTPNCGQTNNFPMVPAPAAADDVIAVGNSNDVNTLTTADDSIFITSHTGPRLSDFDADTLDEQKPEVAAPGTSIMAAQTDSVAGYSNRTGTSHSAPHVSGCAALIKEASPLMPPKSVKKLIWNNAQDMGPVGWDTFWGHGLLDCMNAVAALSQSAGTDLRFDVWDCRPGNPPCWTSASLFAVDPTIKDGEPNTILARITNNGLRPASGFAVAIGVYNFGNGDLDYPVCTVLPPDPVLPGASVDVTCPWTPSLTGPPPGWVSASLKAEIVYPFDTDFTNNKARHSVLIQGGTVVTVPIQVVNPTLTQQTVRLQPIGDCCPPGVPPDPVLCACAGWQLDLSEYDLPMGPEDCPRMVMADLRAVDTDAVREAAYNIPFTGVGPDSIETRLNGVTVKARLGCEVDGLRFVDQQRMQWVGAPFTVCPDDYDIAKVALPLTAAGLSAATCFSNDTPSTSIMDLNLPTPGRGFMYLLRAGGAAPGTWNDGTQTGDRDAALSTTCP